MSDKNTFVFPEEVRNAYERLPLPLAIDQFIDEKVVPLLVSDGFCRLVRMDREAAMRWFIGSQFERIHPDDVGNVARVSDDFAHHRSGYNVVFRAKHADGYHSIHAVGEWMTMPDGTELAVLIYTDISESQTEITALLEKYHLFQQDAFYSDPVTGLPNINYLFRFGNEKVHALRTADRQPVMIYTDINAMQSYNNQYGIEKGDDLLRLLARLIMETFPDSLLVRGTEDQMIIITDLETPEKTTEKIEEMNRRIRQDAYGNTTGFSAGICEFTENMGIPEALDHVRHALRRIGSNLSKVWRFYSPEADEKYWEDLYIVENFDKALENNWIKVYYQCIAETETGHGVSLEALARWVDPVRGMISPAAFVPVLSQYHQLYKLDLYIFEQVCREIEARHRSGLPLVPVSVNFARQDFDQADIPAELNRILGKMPTEKYGIGKDSFIIEITEQDMATAPESFYEQLSILRKNDFRVWLDDFGSAYSSLNVFSKFEVDLIKFDLDLLRNLDQHHGANREILTAITGMCKKLGIHTLAEGVETQEHLDFLKKIGCELAQGYFFHRPEPLETILYKIRNGQKIRQMVPDEKRKQLI